jgi:serine protease Do
MEQGGRDMRNKLWVALSGTGVLGLVLAVFAAGAPGQTSQPAPSNGPGPQAQPAPKPSASEIESREQDAAAKAIDRQAQKMAELSAKLADMDANFDQEKVMGHLQAKLADLDQNMKSMEPAMQEAERKVLELNPEGGMLFDDDQSDGWLGIEIAEISTDRAKDLKLGAVRGVEVVQVETDSPAAKGGLKEHDVITTYDGQTVEGRVQFRRLVRETPPGRTVSLGVSRDGSVQSLNVVIGDRDEQMEKNVRVFRHPEHLQGPSSAFVMPDFDFNFAMPEVMDTRTPLLGISAEDLNGQLGSYFGAPNGEGILVREVRRGTPAEKAGLQAGDVITKVDDKPVKSLRDLRTQLRDKGEQKTVNLGVLRNGSTMNMLIEIEKPRPIDPPQVIHRAQL